jgi:hypothetical protein
MSFEAVLFCVWYFVVLHFVVLLLWVGVVLPCFKVLKRSWYDSLCLAGWSGLNCFVWTGAIFCLTFLFGVPVFHAVVSWAGWWGWVPLFLVSGISLGVIWIGPFYFWILFVTPFLRRDYWFRVE